MAEGNRYIVMMANGQHYAVEADIASVSDYGALTFRKDALIVAAFPPTGWVRMLKEGRNG
jgi:hypothetical protein